MFSKPDKFGISFGFALMLIQSTCVMVSIFRRDESRPQNQSLGECVVLRLMDPYLNTGRNVTTDNSFTSISFAKKLIEKRTSTVGMVNKTRRDISATIKNASLSLYETHIHNSETCTITVYQGKPYKSVMMLSSLHSNVFVDPEEAKKKHNTVKFYNATKFE
ncbi:hypothetical protein WA026_011778 [Henosepilachna vigintioctopunctata]|uniref:PiggyBac transposable element-derived protein domain-containing protein n=1 Tax=Henosepilachna vigintioctopunctata TaxID=420089 RepID=A0AAW1UA76_9CUCU